MNRFEVTGTEVDAMFHDSWPSECPTLEINLLDEDAPIMSAEDVKRMFGINPFDLE
jgi:hypothetical protein